jgi:ligand-binding sensor domain-containing protein
MSFFNNLNSNPMRKLYSYLAFLLITAVPLFAQTPYTIVQNYTTGNGLPVNNIKCVVSDNAGNIWFGSTSGLTKYNGSIMTTYNTSNGLPDNTVNRLHVAQNGDILIATNNGLSRYNGSSFSNDLSGNILKCVFEAQNGNIWVGTSGSGVKRYTSSWTTYTTANGIPHNFVNTITQDLSGNIWIGTSEGVGKFNGTSWTEYTNLNGTNTDADQVISSTCDKSGHVWFGSKPSLGIGGGVTRYDGSTWRHYNTTEGLAGKQVEDMVSDERNGKWFATFTNGASFFRDITYPSTYSFATVSTAGGVISNQINGVCVDNDGYVWLATFSGVTKLAPLKILNVNVVNAICATNFEGSITINALGLHPLLYSINNGSTFQSSNAFTGLSPNTYNVVVSDSMLSLSGGVQTISLLGPVAPGLPDSAEVCEGDSTQLIVANQGSDYVWTPAAYVSDDTIYNPYAFPTTPQYFYLEMLDANGCEVEDSTWISVLPQTPMQIQVNGNIFTCIGSFVTYKWYFYDTEIPGAFTNIYAAVDPGIYHCYATDANGCTTYSGMIHYNNPGFEEFNSDATMNISNQVDHIIIIVENLQSAENQAQLMVFSLNGSKVKEMPLTPTAHNSFHALINTSDMPAGSYIVNITGTGLTGKFSLLK